MSEVTAGTAQLAVAPFGVQRAPQKAPLYLLPLGKTVLLVSVCEEAGDGLKAPAVWP